MQKTQFKGVFLLLFTAFIWGVAFDPNLEDEMRITIVAAGFDNDDAKTIELPAEEAAPAEAPKKTSVFDLLDM